MNVDGEVCFLVRCPYLHLFLVKLEASMLGYAPVCNVLLRQDATTAPS